jgi:hypothetical protein
MKCDVCYGMFGHYDTSFVPSQTGYNARSVKVPVYRSHSLGIHHGRMARGEFKKQKRGFDVQYHSPHELLPEQQKKLDAAYDRLFEITLSNRSHPSDDRNGIAPTDSTPCRDSE